MRSDSVKLMPSPHVENKEYMCMLDVSYRIEPDHL